MPQIRQTEAYEAWMGALLDEEARARIKVRIRRLSLGNPGDVKPVGEGVSELRINYGPGYRVYDVHRGKVVATSVRRPETSSRHRSWREIWSE